MQTITLCDRLKILLMIRGLLPGFTILPHCPSKPSLH